MKKSQSQSQRYGPMKEENIINMEAILMGNSKAELGKSPMSTLPAPVTFQVTPATPFTALQNGTPSFREVILIPFDQFLNDINSFRIGFKEEDF